MLGTNDIMPPVNATAQNVGESVRSIVRIARRELGRNIKVLVISLGSIGILCSSYGDRADRLSQDLAVALERICREECWDFLDARSAVPAADSPDGVHLTVAQPEKRLL